jgi:hypothetical protein
MWSLASGTRSPFEVMRTSCTKAVAKPPDTVFVAKFRTPTGTA